MKKPWCYLILLLVGVGAWAQESATGPAAAESLAKLMAGNQRYVRHEQQHPNQSLARRKELEKGQHPFAVILGCADSRVSRNYCSIRDWATCLLSGWRGTSWTTRF